LHLVYWRGFEEKRWLSIKWKSDTEFCLVVWNPCSVTAASDVPDLWKSDSDNMWARSIIFARNLLQTALYRATPQGDNGALFQ
ncbi:hypothetical protein, partial [Muribaculum intestinale]|uniref:hypothetical protein n=1 Tax=Muribaculum intestinale TaxID=1796646 RepID=UPI0026DFCC91